MQLIILLISLELIVHTVTEISMISFKFHDDMKQENHKNQILNRKMWPKLSQETRNGITHQ